LRSGAGKDDISPICSEGAERGVAVEIGRRARRRQATYLERTGITLRAACARDRTIEQRYRIRRTRNRQSIGRHRKCLVGLDFQIASDRYRAGGRHRLRRSVVENRQVV